MEIKDNSFSRQFETPTPEGMVTVEYSFQDRKIFLTRINTPENFSNDQFIDDFLVEIMSIAEEKKFKVVPIFPRIATFIKKNPKYKDMLPPGIRL
ncbi:MULTISPECIES: GNAT family N-acetyltransferase [Flavobacterium]|uniref:N-acetyltransferase domain-containing protein n=1 Tax=Flavobacterium hankyongi TaxID=1176532 RepID=A0ABP9A7E0_9FLAO|nr:N-acetyltransferase [Flavobacterium sp. N1846]